MTTNLFQITKIQMRQGPTLTLPGAPITLAPLTFGAGLDVGELGFTTDTNRLFVGAAPTNGQVNFNRVSFPYQNVEVLTETSPVVGKVVSGAMKNLSSDGYYRANLGVSATWADILGAPTISGPEMVTRMEYFAYNSTSREALRQGTLRFVSVHGAQQALVLDDGLSSPAAYTTAPTSPGAPLSNTFGFQAVRVGSAFTLQFINNLPDPIILFFSISTPQP